MTERVTPPRTDDRPLWDVVFGLLGYQAVVVAHSLKLFPTLAERPLTLDEVCAALGIAPRPAQALLNVVVSLGFVQVQEGRYALTAIAEDYLLESSPSYFGGFYDFSTIGVRDTYQFDGMMQTVRTDKTIFSDGKYEFLQQQEMARSFTRAMHSHSVGSSLSWPKLLDLANTQVMLDVGGGSGVHTIGAAQCWPQLRGIIFDIAPVCEVAADYIAQANLSDRITTHVGDLWDSPFPEADLHFYSEIYHNWTPEQCDYLTKKSFASLQPGGRIVLHEMLLNNDKSGPFSSAAYSVGMLVWTMGQQFTEAELRAMLSEAGFVDIEVKPSFGYWNIVTGRKPE